MMTRSEPSDDLLPDAVWDDPQLWRHQLDPLFARPYRLPFDACGFRRS
jgi:hypothetical protein